MCVFFDSDRFIYRCLIRRFASSSRIREVDLKEEFMKNVPEDDKAGGWLTGRCGEPCEIAMCGSP